MSVLRKGEVKFWDKVEKTESCWLWTGNKNNSAYGVFYSNGRNYMAHRYSYEMFISSIPKGLVVHHACKVRECVNPEHLGAITNRENVLEGNSPPAKNKRKKECINGHPFSKKNTIILKNIYRVCRICHNRGKVKYRAYLKNKTKKKPQANKP